MNDFDVLKSTANYIKNPETRGVVTKFLDEKVPQYFRTIPASSSGKYHPAYTLGDGGLVRHTIAAVKIAHYLMSVDCAGQVLGLTQDDKDNVIAALILHDTFKRGTTAEGNVAAYEDHEILAAEQFKDYIQADTPIAKLIAAHMGQWGKERPATIAESIVHFADYLASRKSITVDVAGVY
jgi:hypothetical protein